MSWRLLMVSSPDVPPALCRHHAGTTVPEEAVHQFRLLSTRARCLIHGIMARSALNEVWLTRFSSIQLRVKVPDWMSARMRFISARVSSVTTRGPETYSPYSAVLETE